MDDLLKLGIDEQTANKIASAKESFYQQNEVDADSVAVASGIEQNDVFTIVGVSKLSGKIGDNETDGKGAITFENGFKITPCIFETTKGRIGAKHFAKIEWDDKYPNRPKKFNTFDDCLTFGVWAEIAGVTFKCTKVEDVEKRGTKVKKYTIKVQTKMQ